jgi:hypothetical protein
MRQDLETDGVGVEAIRKLMTMLQAAFREALISDRLPPNAGNPVQLMRKPTSRRKLAIVAFSRPASKPCERVPPRDETSVLLITLLAYEGLRPEEALALEERHVGKAALLSSRRTSAMSVGGARPLGRGSGRLRPAPGGRSMTRAGDPGCRRSAPRSACAAG